ncbi:GntR family transcriptional regulator [Rhodobacteraceae bacterium NNCM2]|nr:GntR family transcriptional regulator [Coraliihabitans acroporae]
MSKLTDNDHKNPDAGEIMETVGRSATLTEQVYDRLRRGLLIGVWNPGEKINARQIGRDLGVSLTPAREAIMRLVNEGALDVSANRTFSAVALDLAQYSEMALIRLALEPIAAEMATEKLSDAEIKWLDETNEKMMQRIGEDRFNEALQLDSEFHLTIYDHADMPTLRAMIDSLWLRAGPTRNRLSHTFRKRLIGYENHKRILAALKSRDAEAARDAMTRDLTDGTQSIMAVMKAEAAT